MVRVAALVVVKERRQRLGRMPLLILILLIKSDDRCGARKHRQPTFPYCLFRAFWTPCGVLTTTCTKRGYVQRAPP